MEEKDNAKNIEFLEKAMLALKEEQFTGYIKIEFRRGKLNKIERFEEILKMKPAPNAAPKKKKRP